MAATEARIASPSAGAAAPLSVRLLDAAEAEIVERGSTEISLRAVARRVGVSHQAPGSVFADRAGLLSALAARGYAVLDQAITEARDAQPAGTSGQAVLVEMGVAYVLATTARPALFWLLARPDLGTDDPVLDTARRAAVQTLLSAVHDASVDGWCPGAAVKELAVLAWSTVHGLATLHRGAIHDLTSTSLEDTARATMRRLVDAD